MEEFDSIVWTSPVEDFNDVISAQSLIRNSYAYKILHGSVPLAASSDSAEEQIQQIEKEPTKKRKKRKRNKTKGKQDNNSYSTTQEEPEASHEELKQVVEREQNEFQQYIKHLWKTAYDRHHILTDDVKRFIGDMWKGKLKIVRTYPSSYNLQKMIPLVYSAQSPNVQMTHEQVLLEMGLVPKLHIPEPKFCPQVCTDYSKMTLLHASCKESSETPYRLPVSRDGNAEHLAVIHKANVVISSSSLKCLATNVPPAFDKLWDMPVIVKDYCIKDGDAVLIQKVVFVDKPLPPKHLSASERNVWFHKVALKKQLCHVKDPESFRYLYNEENDGFCDKTCQMLPSGALNRLRARALCNDCRKFLQSRNKLTINGKDDSVSQGNDYDSTDSEQLVIDTHSAMGKTSPALRSPKARESYCTCAKRLRSEYKDKDSSLLIEFEKNDQLDIVHPPSTTNVAYKMWKLHCEERSKEDLYGSFLKGQTTQQKLNVLIRCKLDACKIEKEKMVPFCVSPKLEYQNEYGAETMSLSGLVREWITLFVRPEATIARVHVDAVTEEIIMTEEVKPHDVAQQAMTMYNFRIRSNVLGTLYCVLSSLTSLEAGHYLLSHGPKNGAFVSLLQCNDGENDYDLHEEFDEVKPDILLKTGIPPWAPIDTTLLTPKHISSKRIPCTFAPASERVRKRL